MSKKLRNVIGIVLIVLVIAVVLPLSVPRLAGFEIFNVLSESMEPAYPMDSVLYVQPVEVSELEVGEVITFRVGAGTDDIVTHRIVNIDEAARLITTKGDANNGIDPDPIRFSNVIGRVVFSIPMLAPLADLVASLMGKALLGGVLLAALLLIMSGKKDLAEGDGSGKKRGSGRMVGLIGGGVLVLAATAYLGSTFFDYQKSDTTYDELRSRIFTSTDGTIAPATDGDRYDEEKISQIQENLRALRRENMDVVGWIEFDDSSISYPIMHGADDYYYLKHNYLGMEDVAGSIFLEAANTADFTDAHTIVYGHNMKNGSMFGQLRKYRDKEFYDENRYFTVFTEADIRRYEIFSYYDIQSHGDVYTLGFSHDPVFGEFVKQLLRYSYYDCQVPVSEQDDIVTLSTCSTKGMRFVVHGKKI